MAEVAFIRLADGNGGAAWAVLDASGRLLTPVGRGPLAAARAAVTGRRVVVLVPSTEAVATQAVLPAAGQARLRQLVPYSLEDYVADDVDDLLFAIGAKLSTGATAVTIVAREQLDRWLSTLSDAGISPQVVCTEADGVPDIPGTLCLMIEGERIYGRRAGQSPFVFEGVTLTEALDVLGITSAAESAEEPAAEPAEESVGSAVSLAPRVLVYTDQAGHAHFEAELAELGTAGLSYEIKVLADGAFPHLAATLAQRSATNLLQGPYAPRSNWLAYARPWRVAAGLLLAAALIGAVSRGAEYFALRREATALTDRITTMCSQVVSATRLTACQAEVRQRLQKAPGVGAGAGAAFLDTLAAIAQSRAADLTIDALSYRNSAMDLQLVADNVSTLDDFARALQDTRHYAAKIESTTNSDKGVEGRVKVTGVSP